MYKCNDNQIPENGSSMNPRNVLSIENRKIFWSWQQRQIVRTNEYFGVRFRLYHQRPHMTKCPACERFVPARAWGLYLCGYLIWPAERGGVPLCKFGLLVPPNAAASSRAFRWIRTSCKLQNLQPYIFNIGVLITRSIITIIKIQRIQYSFQD